LLERDPGDAGLFEKPGKPRFLQDEGIALVQVPSSEKGKTACAKNSLSVRKERAVSSWGDRPPFSPVQGHRNTDLFRKRQNAGKDQVIAPSGENEVRILPFQNGVDRGQEFPGILSVKKPSLPVALDDQSFRRSMLSGGGLRFELKGYCPERRHGGIGVPGGVKKCTSVRKCVDSAECERKKPGFIEIELREGNVAIVEDDLRNGGHRSDHREKICRRQRREFEDGAEGSGKEIDAFRSDEGNRTTEASKQGFKPGLNAFCRICVEAGRKSNWTEESLSLVAQDPEQHAL
jgi:hypothetical protein